MLPRVTDLIIREAPDKLNLRFEELASVMLGQSSADSGPQRTMAGPADVGAQEGELRE